MLRSAVRKVPTIEVAGARGMATEKQILMRITSTSNISKITKSMKMVSAAKMKGAERRLKNGRPFAEWLNNGGSSVHDFEEGPASNELFADKNLMLVFTSDRGLCGGCNTFVTKAVRTQVESLKDGQEVSLFVVGEKGQGQLKRMMKKNIIGNLTETTSIPANFTQASTIAQAASSVGDFDKKFVIFNEFESAIKYNTSIRNMGISEVSEDKLAEYELEPDTGDDLLADLKEFELASACYQAMVEGSASEESARMTAMENATSNAEEMIEKLQLQYNKARQARITTELIEIISGASALDDADN